MAQKKSNNSGGNKGGSNGGGNASLKPSADHDAARRAAKKARHKTGVADRVGMPDTFGLCSQPANHGPRRRTYTRPLTQREQANIDRRLNQARKALEYPELRNLKGDTTEFAIVEGVLLIFANHQPTKGLKRTESCIKHVVGKGMRAGKMKDLTAIARGKKLVNKALYWAHQQLEADASRADTTPASPTTTVADEATEYLKSLPSRQPVTA